MQTAQAFERIREEGAAVRVVTVRRDQRPSPGKSDDDGGVIEIARLSAQLNEIADFQFFETGFLRKGAGAVVSDEKAIKIFDARPGRGAVVCVDVKPARHGREVHDFCARVQALGGEIGAVAADPAEIVISGIPAERPFPGIFRGGFSVIRENFNFFHTVFYVENPESALAAAPQKYGVCSAENV